MNSKLSNLLKALVSVSIAAVLLFFSFRGVDWREFATSLSSCNWWYVAISMACGVVAFVFRGLRWRRMLMPIDPSTGRVPAINGIMIGNVANMVIPYSGELVRCGVITRHSSRDPETGKPLATYDRVIGNAVLERGWDILSVVILLVILLFFKWKDFGGFMTEKIFAPMADALDLVFWLVFFLISAAVTAALVAVRKMRNKNKTCGKISGVISRIFQGFMSCFKMRDKGIFFLYTAIIWVMYWLQAVLILNAFPVLSGLSLDDALFLMLVGSFATCMPVPGGFGAYHYIVSSALFAIYGFPQAGVGIVFATLSHESQALTMIITGLASYIIESLDKH